MKTAEDQQKVMGETDGGESGHLIQVARQVFTAIGTGFFEALAKELAKALDADCVYIGEFTGRPVQRVRTLAACLDRERIDEFDFLLAGTPEAEVALGRPCTYSRGVRERFPSDRRLSDWRADAYIGVPLNDCHGLACGVIAALCRHPLSEEEIRFAQSMLTTFAPRSAAELQRKQADEALRENEERYRTFIMLNGDAIWRVEFERPIAIDLPEQEQLESFFRYGYVVECNDATARVYGFDKAERLIGARIGDLYPKKTYEETLRDPNHNIAVLVRSGYRFSTVEIKSVDAEGNQRYWLRTQWGIVENDKLRRVWGMTKDITELRRSQMELASAERRFARLLEAVQLATVMLDREGAITYCNDYLLKLTGWRAEEVIGKNWFDLMLPRADQGEKMRAAFSPTPSRSHGQDHFEGTLLGRGGRRWIIDWHCVVLHDSAGKITGSAGVGRDITEYRELETQLRQSQKLESIGRLAGAVAHDFNNLLTIILGYSGHLLEHMDEKDATYADLGEIRQAAEKGSALTNQLLAFSRGQIPQPQVLNLNAVIAQDEPMLRRLIGEDVALTTNLGASLGCVRADPGGLHQVLMNLAVNARDAMPNGGKLIIASSNVDLKETDSAHLPGIEPGRYVQLIVTDTGFGMSEEVKAHLFEPFFTTKAPTKGTGLGLSTAYGIIRQIGGRILVETAIGKGTTFEIFLPVVETPAEGPSVAAEATPVIRGGTETILLVEDQKELRDLMSAVLRRLGYTVLEADGGRQALQFFDSHGASIHLVVTDVIMPGMSGIELAEHLKASHSETPVLYISGYSDGALVQTVRDTVPFYLQKPFAPEALAAKVRDILGRQTRNAGDSAESPAIRGETG